MQSILRWAGSKRLLLPELRKHVPKQIGRYVEPFAGSAAIFFSEQPGDALLADINEELMTTYRALRADASLVLECLSRIPIGREEYYQVRSNNTEDWADCQIAARFLYLNRHCFNGLYRTNAAGRFNVPYCPPNQPKEGFAQRVLDAGRLLCRAKLKSQDFEETIAEARDGDFFYLDPPYAVDEKRVFREYLPGSFSRRDLKRLRSALEALDRCGVAFLLSYARAPEADVLARGWYHRVVVTRRNVAGFVTNRRIAEELLVSNRPLEERQACQ